MSTFARTAFRSASRTLEPFVERSHEAIRQWVRRLAPICDRFDVDRRSVSAVFVDETMIKVRRQMWGWVAFEPGLRAFLAFRISYNQSTLDAYLCLNELRRRSKYGLKKSTWTEDEVSGCVQVGKAGASRLRPGAEEPDREGQPVPEGQARMLRRSLPAASRRGATKRSASATGSASSGSITTISG